MSRDSGYTGLCIFYPLQKLYGFDVMKDLVYDMMHNIPMNVVSSLLHRFISEESITPDVDDMLKKFPWTLEVCACEKTLQFFNFCWK